MIIEVNVSTNFGKFGYVFKSIMTALIALIFFQNPVFQLISIVQ